MDREDILERLRGADSEGRIEATVQAAEEWVADHPDDRKVWAALEEVRADLDRSRSQERG